MFFVIDIRLGRSHKAWADQERVPKTGNVNNKPMTQQILSRKSPKLTYKSNS